MVGRNPPYLRMRAVALRGPNLRSVRGEYRLGASLVARRHAVACLVHGNFLCVRASCGLRIHRPTDDARALYVHERIKNCLQIITCSASRARLQYGSYVVRSWSVRGLCLLGTSSVQLSKKRTKLRRTLSSKLIVAWCAH